MSAMAQRRPGAPPARMGAMRAVSTAARRDRVRARLAEGKKTCARCCQLKAVAGFWPSGGRGDGLDSWCKSCRCEDQAARRRRLVAGPGRTTGEIARAAGASRSMVERIRSMGRW
jgi:hypothetical protein